MNEHDMTLASVGAHLVPAGFAEKAMASLMQLHSELVTEKERRVQLYRALMQKEQALAELSMYVRVLEERMAAVGPAAAAPAIPPPAAGPVSAAGPRSAAKETRVTPAPSTVKSAGTPPPPSSVSAGALASARLPSVPHASRAHAPAAEGWKTW